MTDSSGCSDPASLEGGEFREAPVLTIKHRDKRRTMPREAPALLARCRDKRRSNQPEKGKSLRSLVPASSPSTLLETGSREDLLQVARTKIRSGSFSAIFIELCCEKDSILCQEVIPCVLAMRVIAVDNIALKETRRALHGFVREAHRDGCANLHLVLDTLQLWAPLAEDQCSFWELRW